MFQDPNGVYTYCSDYNSASIENTQESATQINREEEKQKWLTADGFVVSSSKTALESNRHPQKPDNARVMELSKVSIPQLFQPIETRKRDYSRNNACMA